MDSNTVYATWTNAGARVFDNSDTATRREIPYEVPEAPPGRSSIQLDDSLVNANGLIYATDRFTGGLYIFERTACARQGDWTAWFADSGRAAGTRISVNRLAGISGQGSFSPLTHALTWQPEQVLSLSIDESARPACRGGAQAVGIAATASRPNSATAVSRMRNFWILPVTVIGKPSTNFQ